MYQRVGAAAYKASLDNTIYLCDVLGNPQNKFRSIHIAGTNGKGSTSHMLAAILQTAGYKTGLYTSPHLKEFTERIKIDGREVEQEFVVDFVNRIQAVIEKIKPSFFELTVAMAFDYFALQHVDVAVIEVGLAWPRPRRSVCRSRIASMRMASSSSQVTRVATRPATVRDCIGPRLPQPPRKASPWSSTWASRPPLQCSPACSKRWTRRRRWR